MIYVDALQLNIYNNPKFKYKQFCHMISNKDVNELIIFAKKIGLKERWLQTGYIPHFDITANKRMQAIDNGAKECTMAQFVKIMKELRKKNLDK